MGSKEAQKRWEETHKEERKEYFKCRYKEKKKELIQKKIEWTKNTVLGRATMLLSAYNRSDKLSERGHGNLTAKWIVENILSKPCAHCGKTGWNIIGCNRLDNSKPHTKDNVEPCCEKCNNEQHHKDVSKQIDQIDRITGEIIATYDSISQAAKQVGGNTGSISNCCRGGYYTRGKRINVTQSYGFVWKFR